MRCDEEKGRQAAGTPQESKGQRREWVRAGSDYGEHELKRVQCCRCAKALMIRPRIWPYFSRRRDKTIGWFCSMQCMQWSMWEGGVSLDDRQRGGSPNDGL